METSLLLSSSVVGAVIAALLNSFWNRQAAKKIPKTQMRAEEIPDLVVHMVAGLSTDSAAPQADTADARALAEIKARLLLFGETPVVCATSKFLAEHGELRGDAAVDSFVKVVGAMRSSLLTGNDALVAESIRTLLSQSAKRA